MYTHQHTHTQRHTTLKTLNCSKKKVANVMIPKQTLGKWHGSGTKAFSHQRGLHSDPYLVGDTPEWEGRYSGQPLAGADFRCFAGTLALFFWTGSNPKILNPNSPRAQPRDSSRTKWLSQICRNGTMYETALGREGSSVEFDFPSASKEYKCLASLRQWFVAG